MRRRASRRGLRAAQQVLIDEIDHQGDELLGLIFLDEVARALDGDGRLEIGSVNEHVYTVVDDGRVLWTVVVAEKSSGFTGSSVFAFEGDGAAEVVYRDEVRLRITQALAVNVRKADKS